MYIVTYDFESNRRRSQFAKFLKKFGRRIQYSIFEVKNSARALRNILTEVEMEYAPHFTNSDSIIILQLCETCKGKVRRYGYAANEEEEVVMF